MTATVFAVVLFSALLHAGWNVAVKRTDDPRATAALVVVSAGVIAAVILPFLPAPAPSSLPYMAGSVVLQVVYVVLLAAAYRAADMSLVYPLMRGAPPLVVAAVSIGWFGETLSPPALLGIACVAVGILSLGLGARLAGSGRGAVLALLDAVVIAGYTLVDGTGVRLSGSPAAYTLWEAVATAVPFLGWVLVAGGPSFRAHARSHALAGLVGGAATTAAYGLALWAMTVAPIPVVAALREVSIVFALILARVVLGEKPGRRRIAAAGLVAFGAAVLRLA